MHKLCEEILLLIFEYGGYKTMFIDKFLYNKIISIRNEFREKPLKINYNLIKWKEKHFAYNDGTLIKNRPSFYNEKIKSENLYGKIPLKFMDNYGNIQPSTLLKDKIIPISETSTFYNSNYGVNKTIYYTIHKIITNNIKKAKLYKLVWN